MLKPRNYKVMDGLATSRGAHLRFRGQWLIEAGFRPGASFTLTSPEPGVIHLTIDQPTQTEQEFGRVMAQFDKLGIA